MKPKFIPWLALVLSANCHAALVYPNPPDGGSPLVHEYVKASVRHAATIAAPFREYFVEPRDVALGRLLSVVKPGGWRYLLFHGTNSIGEVNCATDVKPGHALICTDIGTNDCLARGLRVAEQLPQIKNDDYEVRSFGTSVFRGMWLHAKSDNMFIPTDDGFGRWAAYQPYSQREFANLIKPLQRYEKQHLRMEKKVHDQFDKNVTAYGKAMMDYETAHENAGSRISPYYIEDLQCLQPEVEIVKLQGRSSNGGILAYKAKVTYKDKWRSVKQVEILEKMTPSSIDQ